MDSSLTISARGPSKPLLRISELTAGYRDGRRLLPLKRMGVVAVRGVSFDVERGSCVGIVGESGSGKTTLARCIAGLHAPAAGTMLFDGELLAPLAQRRSVSVRRRIQMVFQDADNSLNPSMTVGQIIGRPLRRFFGMRGGDAIARIRDLLEIVRLPASVATRPSRLLSGGEKQRVAIARALAAQPELLICDEITSALDVAVQASILELLCDLRETTHMAVLFISHNLAVVRSVADQVLIMRRGEIRESGATEVIFRSAKDDYTRRLLGAVPTLRPTDYPGLTGGTLV
jgi:peptide/nickel transport system ATP-binding protein